MKTSILYSHNKKRKIAWNFDFNRSYQQWTNLSLLCVQYEWKARNTPQFSVSLKIQRIYTIKLNQIYLQSAMCIF